MLNNNKCTNQNTLSSDCLEFQLFTGEDFNALIDSSDNSKPVYNCNLLFIN